MHESFISYRSFFYLKVALGLCLAAMLAYAIHAPADPPNGGTWLGYTLGTLGAGLIGWLAWFGVRKRSYSGNVTRVAHGSRPTSTSAPPWSSSRPCTAASSSAGTCTRWLTA